MNDQPKAAPRYEILIWDDPPAKPVTKERTRVVSDWYRKHWKNRRCP